MKSVETKINVTNNSPNRNGKRQTNTNLCGLIQNNHHLVCVFASQIKKPDAHHAIPFAIFHLFNIHEQHFSVALILDRLCALEMSNLVVRFENMPSFLCSVTLSPDGSIFSLSVLLFTLMSE